MENLKAPLMVTLLYIYSIITALWHHHWWCPTPVSGYKCRILYSLCPHLFSSVTPQLITHRSQLCSSSPPRHYISTMQEAGAFHKVVFPWKAENNQPCADPCVSNTQPHTEGQNAAPACNLLLLLYCFVLCLYMKNGLLGWHLNAPREVISGDRRSHSRHFGSTTPPINRVSVRPRRVTSCMGLILHMSVWSWVCCVAECQFSSINTLSYLTFILGTVRSV